MNPETMKSISDLEFDSLTFESSMPTVVFFGAERCTVCKELLPTVEELAEEYAEKVRFYMVDVDEYKSLVTRCRLRGIPQLLLFKNGEIRERIGGLRSKEELLDSLGKLLNL
ncbi:MAG: thioredoxin family protein [Clostridia bacterium]|jgi:thioredoxin 1|nr:thioredoxin family protein [Clostridia bacterium]